MDLYSKFLQRLGGLFSRFGVARIVQHDVEPMLPGQLHGNGTTYSPGSTSDQRPFFSLYFRHVDKGRKIKRSTASMATAGWVELFTAGLAALTES